MTTSEIILAVHVSGAALFASACGAIAETRRELAICFVLALLWPVVMLAFVVAVATGEAGE